MNVERLEVEAKRYSDPETFKAGVEWALKEDFDVKPLDPGDDIYAWLHSHFNRDFSYAISCEIENLISKVISKTIKEQN